MKQIDRSKMTSHEIEQHFFKKGYAYALLHFELAVEEEKIPGGLEKKIRKYMDFLENTQSGN